MATRQIFLCEWSCQSLFDLIFLGGFVVLVQSQNTPGKADDLGFRISVALGIWSEGDHWDWNAICEWTESIHPLLTRQRVKPRRYA